MSETTKDLRGPLPAFCARSLAEICPLVLFLHYTTYLPNRPRQAASDY